MTDKCVNLAGGISIDHNDEYITSVGIGGFIRDWMSSISNDIRRIRKRVGSAIIGHPKYGEGITLKIPLGQMTEEQVKAYWDAEKLFIKAGIGFDTGLGCHRDLEWDWSLYGAMAVCRRCGYHTKEHVKKYHRRREKEHDPKCDGFACNICNDPERHYRCMDEGY